MAHIARLTRDVAELESKLTLRQKRVLDFIKKYVLKYGNFPKSRTIQKYFSWKSQTSALTHLKALEKKGHVRKWWFPETRTTCWALENYDIELHPKEE